MKFAAVLALAGYAAAFAPAAVSKVRCVVLVIVHELCFVLVLCHKCIGEFVNAIMYSKKLR